MFMSLIHTCNLGKVNPFDYLTALQKNSSEVFKNPRNWLPSDEDWKLPENWKEIILEGFRERLNN